MRRVMLPKETGERVAHTISQVMTRTTVVRIAMAALELIPSTPTFARMAVAPAKSAERMDQKSQLLGWVPTNQDATGDRRRRLG